MTRNAQTIWINPDEEYLRLPFVISFPRTGTHWLNTMLELYFEKNRVLPDYPGSITFVNKFDEDFMWYSTHDNDLSVEPKGDKKALYLYRDPVDVMYSLITAHLNSPDDDEKGWSAKQLLDRYTIRYRDHLEKWLLGTLTETTVTYEGLRKNPLEALSKVVSHFGHDVDTSRAEQVIKYVTKERVHERGIKVMPAYFNQNYLSNDYANKREKFRAKYSRYIYDRVISEPLKPWFTHLEEK